MNSEQSRPKCVSSRTTVDDMLSMPVVDRENRLVGIITIDDVVDVVQDEATEDFELMAAMTPSDKRAMRS